MEKGDASSNCFTTCLQALHDVAGVGNIETLLRPFGGDALVGPALVVAGFFVKSLLMRSLAEAELPSLRSMTDRTEDIARKLFVSAYGTIATCLRGGGGEELVKEFADDVLAAIFDYAALAADVERHILHRHTWRAMHVNDVGGLRTRLAAAAGDVGGEFEILAARPVCAGLWLSSRTFKRNLGNVGTVWRKLRIWNLIMLSS